MPCQRPLKAALRQVITLLDSHAPSEAKLRAAPTLSRLQRQHSTDTVAAAPTHDGDENRDMPRRVRPKVSRVAPVNITKHFKQPQLSTTEPIFLENDNERSIVRWLGSKNDGKASLRYVAAFTDASRNRVEKWSRLSEMHKERQAEMLVQDFKHVLKLLEDATSTPAEDKKGATLERQGSQGSPEQDLIDEMEFEQLGDILNDITYAPPRTPVPLRPVLQLDGTSAAQDKLEQRPQVWTTFTFAAYVDNLVKSVSKREQWRLSVPSIRSPPKDYIKAESAELVALFTDKQYTHCVSSNTLDRCVIFLVRLNNHDAIRQMYNDLKDHAHAFTQSNFDTLLYAAATNTSCGDYQPILQDMLNTGLQPTAKTWSSFYRLVCRKFPQRIHFVVRAIRRKGLVAEPIVSQQIIANAVDTRLAAYLDQGLTPELFLKKQESVYGERSKWLGPLVVNRICRVLLEKGMSADALELVRQMPDFPRTRGFKSINSTIEHTFIAPGLRDRKTMATIRSSAGLTPKQRSTWRSFRSVSRMANPKHYFERKRREVARM